MRIVSLLMSPLAVAFAVAACGGPAGVDADDAASGDVSSGNIGDVENAGEGEAGSISDAANALERGLADASICSQDLDALCKQPNAGCILDWAAAIGAALRSGDGGGRCCDCGGPGTYRFQVCGRYNLLVQGGTDSSGFDYYDAITGKLVAIVGHDANRNTYQCAGGPPEFVVPSCPPLRSLCDLAADAAVE